MLWLRTHNIIAWEVFPMVPYATLRLRLFPHLRWGFANYSISHRNKRINLLFRKDILFANIHCCNLTGCCHFYICIIHTVINHFLITVNFCTWRNVYVNDTSELYLLILFSFLHCPAAEDKTLPFGFQSPLSVLLLSAGIICTWKQIIVHCHA